MTDSIHSLLQRLVNYPVSESNAEAVWLQLLAARALLQLGPPAKTAGDLLAAARTTGQNGGIIRAQKLSPARRSEIARKAAQTRWNGHDQ
jgi:hypothetical protein